MQECSTYILINKDTKVKKYALLAVAGNTTCGMEVEEEPTTETKHCDLVKGGADKIGLQYPYATIERTGVSVWGAQWSLSRSNVVEIVAG